MENKRAVLWSITAALVAVVFFWLYVNKAVDREIGDLKQKRVILVANGTIPIETRIEPNMVKEVEYPEAYLPPKVATSLSDIVGQVTIATIFDNEPILTSKVLPFDEVYIERRIKQGYRAVTIGIRDDQDVVGVGGMLKPGHFVDILLTLFVNTKEIEKSGAAAALAAVEQNSNLKAEVRTVFQNVMILAVGRDARIQSANVSRSLNQDAELATKNVTVALKPDEVQRLVLAQSTGRITLSLRGKLDEEVVALDYLDPYRAFGIRLPIVQGPTPAYREIRGGQVFATPY